MAFFANDNYGSPASLLIIEVSEGKEVGVKISILDSDAPFTNGLKRLPFRLIIFPTASGSFQQKPLQAGPCVRVRADGFGR
jgi:hypothetical protein